MSVRLALSIISGRVDPGELTESQYETLGFRAKHHPGRLEPHCWANKDDVLARAEDIVAERLKMLQKEIDSKPCAHIRRTFGTCDDCGLMGL